MGVIVIIAGLALTVAGLVAVFGPVVLIPAGLTLTVLGIVVDWEKVL